MSNGSQPLQDQAGTLQQQKPPLKNANTLSSPTATLRRHEQKHPRLPHQEPRQHNRGVTTKEGSNIQNGIVLGTIRKNTLKVMGENKPSKQEPIDQRQ
mmetsp:Transcript_13176/g.31569  ORF Transcript_13176/g.31569 Transcript_13176/m.31569 type:complete len:98 (-) Transcript_13176:236-529(-)